MIAKIVYTVIAISIFAFGLISNFYPAKLKQLMQLLYDKELFYIPGIFEVASSLMILYFRYNTSFPLVITIVGVLIFVDGIFYISGNQILRDTFDQILEMEDSAIRYYSIVFYILAAILIGGIL